MLWTKDRAVAPREFTDRGLRRCDTATRAGLGLTGRSVWQASQVVSLIPLVWIAREGGVFYPYPVSGNARTNQAAWLRSLWTSREAICVPAGTDTGP